MKLYFLIVILIPNIYFAIVINPDKKLKLDIVSDTSFDKNEIDNYKNDIIYTYLPDDLKELESVKYKKPRIVEPRDDITRKASNIINQRFQDVINDIKVLKIELFGSADENMDFFKRNRNAYDANLLQRSMKIAKILELEELLEFYQNQHINLDKLVPVRIDKDDMRYTTYDNSNYNAIINITSRVKNEK